MERPTGQKFATAGAGDSVTGSTQREDLLCEESKPVGEFRRLRASRDGPHRWWDQCQIADARSRNFPVCETGTIVGVQCHAEKGELEFYADKRLRSGRVRLCKSCRKSRRMYRSAESGRTDRDRGEWVTKRERHGFHRCRDCGHSGYVVAGRSRHEDTGEGQSTLTLKHANGVVCGQLSEQQFVRWNPMPQASQGALQARSEGVGVVRRRITSGFARGGRCGTVEGYEALNKALAACKTFTSSSAGHKVTGSVGAMSFPAVGNRSSAYAITINIEGVNAGADIVIFQTGTYVAAVLYEDIGTPDLQQVQAFVKEALEKIEGTPTVTPTTF